MSSISIGKDGRGVRVKASDLASIFGVHFQTVGNWLRKGLPHRREGKETTVDLGDAVQWTKARWEQDLEDLRTKLSDEGSKARREAANARLAELKVAREEGALIDADEVRDRWVQAAAAAREAMLSVPATAVQSGLVPRDREEELAGIVRDALMTLSEREPGADQ